ncbi:MAG TPA: YdeI/OmpD-associated family protein [Candidatus Dormibacteraeota bacterium]|nr:YdeI/OmpD-associated family protein [Candidatus Dormibacteraeota bacterium]
MAPTGIAAVERARSDGSWSVLNSVERLEVPADLEAALDPRPLARRNWEAFPPSARRALLERIAVAGRDETRARRIEEIAAAAQLDQRAHVPCFTPSI